MLLDLSTPEGLLRSSEPLYESKKKNVQEPIRFEILAWIAEKSVMQTLQIELAW